MEQRPDQPPEGRLIAAAADNLNLSIREAARRAGISYGRWRQIVKGYQNVSPGSYAPVHAPAKTLAKMAAVVGVNPRTVRRWIGEHLLPAHRTLGGQYRVPRVELDRLKGVQP